MTRAAHYLLDLGDSFGRDCETDFLSLLSWFGLGSKLLKLALPPTWPWELVVGGIFVLCKTHTV